jgi:DNA-binding MarR family transcriptional regulator
VPIPPLPEFPTADPHQLQRASSVIAATCAGFNLRRASRAVTQHFDRALAPVGLRSTQFTILGATALGGQVTVSQLSQALVVDRTTLTRNLKLLRDGGLIAAARQPAGRQIRYQLTEAGREILARAIPHWHAAQERIEQAFGQASWPLMVHELGRLVNGTLDLSEHATARAAIVESHDEVEHVIPS